MPYLGTFRSKFEKFIVTLEISTLEFVVKMQSFTLNNKEFNLKLKLPYLVFFDWNRKFSYLKSAPLS